jgi:hypothetical protein|nr:MAG TPA: hypothetical protein [Caudoviricetes sp.]
MIPINELQSKIYQALNSLDIKVYDEVPLNSAMPLISIGDYNLSSMEYKNNGFIFLWTINIYTEYEGKKQVNELVSESIESLYQLKNQVLNQDYCIDDVMLNEANINRIEGFYVANLSIRIEIN